MTGVKQVQVTFDCAVPPAVAEFWKAAGTVAHVYGGTYTFAAGRRAPGTSDPGDDTPDSPTARPGTTPSPLIP